MDVVLFKGDRGVIKLDKAGRYITMHKDGDDRIWYDYDLKRSVFRKHRVFKTKPEEVVETVAEKITRWFYDHNIITSNEKFAKLILFNKFNFHLDRFHNPVRFIDNLKWSNCFNLEQWYSYDVPIKEVEDLFIQSVENNGLEPRRYYGGNMGYYTVRYPPSYVDKDVLKYIKQYAEDNGPIPLNLLASFCEIKSGNQLKIVNTLNKKVLGTYREDLFEYTQWRRTHNLLKDGMVDFSMRKLVNIIDEYNLDIDRFLEYLEFLQHECIDIGWIADHYGDYLEAEFYLRGELKRKMDKYPEHLIYWHHVKTQEYAAHKKEVDARKFNRICCDNNQYSWLPKGKDFQVIVPIHPDDLRNEGKVLNHCVGTYIEKVMQGKTFIAFLRRREKNNEGLQTFSQPYVTIEIKGNALVTAYGESNTKPEPEALDFLRDYAKEKHLDLQWCWER